MSTRVFAVVFNHGLAEAALALRDVLRESTSAIAVDSGSKLTDRERDAFDVCLPNVYYSGLMNVAVEHAIANGAQDDDALLVVCSDVGVADARRLVERACAAFERADVGVYAPALSESPHRSMRSRGRGELRDVMFVEGACFAARIGLFRDFCPVDTSTNAFGWGLDRHLGYVARRKRMRCVVDDGIVVRHENRSGYDRSKARRARDIWLRQMPREARLYAWLSAKFWSHTRVGAALMNALPWTEDTETSPQSASRG